MHNQRKKRKKMINEKKNMSDTSLKKHGVMRVSTDVYHVGPYKYSNQADALAEAQRAADRKAR